MIIDEIVARKRERLDQAKRRAPLEELMTKVEALPGTGRREPAFRKALLSAFRPALIAEVKRASPSRGLIREDFDPAAIACAYREGGAAAISVLTEEDFFRGSPSHLMEVKGCAGLPVLRKDFILEEYQLYESRLMGADAILLIASVLNERDLRRFAEVGSEIGLECLVEVHTGEELEVALAAGSNLVGINNRDLRSFETDLKTTEILIRHIPPGTVVVSESGINSRADVVRLADAGVHAVLVGESLMRSRDIRAKVMELAGRESERPAW
ncbi:MAG: indole-3-glycerol phosphate synthase TrpC [Firmicutes bacterium]|nr:indole-3-glycerol phosphate synthase TrpC [Bacillota bacterium]